MEKKDIKVGMIVRVVNGIAYGNFPGTITKVLATKSNKAAELLVHDEMIVCEAIDEKGVFRLNNKSFLYEHRNDVVPATEEEKKLYRKHKHQSIVSEFKKAKS